MRRVLRGLSVAVLVAGALGLTGCREGTTAAEPASDASTAATASPTAGSRSPAPSAKPSRTRPAQPSRSPVQADPPRKTANPVSPTGQTPPSHIRPRHRGTSVTKAVVSADRRTLTLTYWQSNRSCGEQWRGHHTLVSGQVAVWMSQDSTAGPGRVTCAHTPIRCHADCTETATLRLAKPLGDRAVYDAYTGKRLS